MYKTTFEYTRPRESIDWLHAQVPGVHSLKEIDAAVKSLSHDVSSTFLGARSDLSRAGSVGYAVLYAVHHTKEGLGALVEKLRAAFAKRGQRSEATAQDDSEA